MDASTQFLRDKKQQAQKLADAISHQHNTNSDANADAQEMDASMQFLRDKKQRAQKLANATSHQHNTITVFPDGDIFSDYDVVEEDEEDNKDGGLVNGASVFTITKARGAIRFLGLLALLWCGFQWAFFSGGHNTNRVGISSTTFATLNLWSNLETGYLINSARRLSTLTEQYSPFSNTQQLLHTVMGKLGDVAAAEEFLAISIQALDARCMMLEQEYNATMHPKHSSFILNNHAHQMRQLSAVKLQLEQLYKDVRRTRDITHQQTDVLRSQLQIPVQQLCADVLPTDQLFAAIWKPYLSEDGVLAPDSKADHFKILHRKLCTELQSIATDHSKETGTGDPYATDSHNISQRTQQLYRRANTFRALTHHDYVIASRACSEWCLIGLGVYQLGDMFADIWREAKRFLGSTWVPFANMARRKAGMFVEWWGWKTKEAVWAVGSLGDQCSSLVWRLLVANWCAMRTIMVSTCCGECQERL